MGISMLADAVAAANWVPSNASPTTGVVVGSGELTFSGLSQSAK